MTTDDKHPAGPPDRALDDLIVQHLDGGLDPAGQRRLADLLAASADARRTLATYLRLEGATLRLASAGLLGNAAATAGAATPIDEPSPAARTPASGAASAAARDRARWLWPTSLAIAAGLLVAVMLVQLPYRAGWPVAAHADLDRLADNWIAVSQDADAVSRLTAETFPAGDTAGHDTEPTETPEGVAAPPGWLVAALADAAPDSGAPDEG